MGDIAVMILAAGAATRMNQAKMLLPFNGSIILQHIIDASKKIEPENIIVVTGFYHNAILHSIQDEAIQFVFNEHWREGMSASIKKGLDAILFSNPHTKAVFILVADQPFLTSDHLQEMLLQFETQHKNIVASQYGAITGTPVLLSATHFSKLEKLSGDKGARSILQEFPEDLILVDFPDGAKDIDTAEDYRNYCLKN